MQCTCLSDVEEKMAEHYSYQLGVPAKAECLSIAITLRETIESYSRVIYTITADKPGFRKGKDVTLTGNYCPICGKATKILQPSKERDSDDVQTVDHA